MPTTLHTQRKERRSSEQNGPLKAGGSRSIAITAGQNTLGRSTSNVLMGPLIQLSPLRRLHSMLGVCQIYHLSYKIINTLVLVWQQQAGRHDSIGWHSSAQTTMLFHLASCLNFHDTLVKDQVLAKHRAHVKSGTPQKTQHTAITQHVELSYHQI